MRAQERSKTHSTAKIEISSNAYCSLLNENETTGIAREDCLPSELLKNGGLEQKTCMYQLQTKKKSYSIWI